MSNLSGFIGFTVNPDILYIRVDSTRCDFLQKSLEISEENQIELSRLRCTKYLNYIVNSVEIDNAYRITDSTPSDFSNNFSTGIAIRR